MVTRGQRHKIESGALSGSPGIVPYYDDSIYSSLEEQ